MGERRPTTQLWNSFSSHGPKVNTTFLVPQGGSMIGGMRVINPQETTEVPKRFSFDNPEERRLRARQKLGFPADLSYDIDIKDVAQRDEDDMAESVRELINIVIHSLYFKGLIFSIIALNALHVALQTLENIAVPYSKVFFVVDNIIMGIFVFEIVLKWFCGFRIFWKDPWNILDFIIVFTLHFGPWLQFVSNTRLLRVLRVIRAFRSLKSVGLKTVASLRGLSLVVETILQSLPDMANIVLLLGIFTLVLSVVGVKLFGRYVPEYFGDPIKCMFSIFVCFTQDGWLEILKKFEPFAVQDTFTYISATLFFIVTILTAAFIIANIIVAVVATNLDRVMKELKYDQDKKADVAAISTKYLFASGREKTSTQANLGLSIEEESSLVMIDKVLDALSSSKMRSPQQDENELHKNQRGIFKSDFSHVTQNKLENYFMLLIAFDKNLKEHKRLRKLIAQTAKIIRALNDKSESRLGELQERRITRKSHSLSSFAEAETILEDE